MAGLSVSSATLVVFGGLPGVGKSTIAQALLRSYRALYLRIDTIEQALRDGGGADAVGPAGYLAAQAIAETNLRLGHAVVADCVNPLPVTREAWCEVAKRARVPVLEIEVVCSDRDVHRHRVASRRSQVPGLRLPDWTSVQAHEYAAWHTPRMVIDSATLSPAAAAATLLTRLQVTGVAGALPAHADGDGRCPL